MKNNVTFFIIILLSFSFTSKKTATKVVYSNTSFFNNKSYTLSYFLEDGVQKELDLINPNDPSGNTTRATPNLSFYLDAETTELKLTINGYCNQTEANISCNDTYLDVISRGATTLSDCGGDEETDYFAIITGNIYLETPAKKVFYEITDNERGLVLWTEENHKLYFSLNTLTTKENELSKSIKTYPNPANDFIYINYGNNIISRITVMDIEGKEVLKQTTNFEMIDISKLPSNYYLLKIITDEKITITKKIIKK